MAYLAVTTLFTKGPLSYLPSALGYVSSPCSIPGASVIPICWSSSYDNDSTRYPQVPEFNSLMKAQSAFEEVLESATAGYTLPLAMKHSESSIRDLRSVIKHSFLPSKHSLEFEMSGFIDTARESSADLSKFNSHIGRAVDHIIVSNRFTLQVLDDFSHATAEQGALSRFMSSNFPWLASRSLTEDHLVDRYLRQASEVEEEIQRLIIEAQALMKLLENLDDRLDVIHDIVTRDGVHIQGTKEELFAGLWTKLGGNRKTAAKMDQQIDLLKWVGAHRKQAMQQVSWTVVKLQAINAELENLREKVAESEVAGVETSLQQHVESILMGVERLEGVRANARSAEKDVYRGIMDRDRASVSSGVGGKKNEIDGMK
ncbi:hypothetical protein EJ08DRAFT_580650 [Tothia fuscella]|uniref:Uncharacterized protein n=1 Tax=Tothia fuscella TaxID=1048955 RepID=A0A9P4P1B4_9PEZI|nr:hypothetical protein EJ08DRAFT_580650 [Tothia fuscella]